MFNLDLLKFMGERVRIKKDISHQEYEVFGILWDTEELLVFELGKPIHYTKVDIIPRKDDE